MWRFYSRQGRATRRALRLAFSRYESPDLIEKLEGTPEALKPSVQRGTIPYIILQVRDDDFGAGAGLSGSGVRVRAGGGRHDRVSHAVCRGRRIRDTGS